MTGCEVCEEHEAKYRCPVCAIKYCSVSCYKRHKENNCIAEKKLEDSSNKLAQSGSFGLVREEGELTSSDSEASDSDEREFDYKMLQQLDHSDDIKQILLNPHLCDMIENIDESSDPERALRDALDIPIFTEFADTCLSICSSSKK